MSLSIPFLIIVLLTIASWFYFLPKLFAKAGQKASAGYVPGYNLVVWQKVTDRPLWWLLILLIPGVNVVMIAIMHVQLAWSFGFWDTKSTLMAIFVPFIFFPMIVSKDNVKYTGNIDWEKEKKGFAHEWGDAILFALIAAFIIRTFTFEAFTIPTPSMEESMLVGDYLFVNKMKYGARVPMTPLAFPLAHHTMPFINTKAYLEWVKLDYMRLPGWSDVQRGDAVVFNFPEGDTVMVRNQGPSFYDTRRQIAFFNSAVGNEEKYIQNEKKYLNKATEYLKNKYGGLDIRPTDKKENYVKRCVGIAGDKLEIINQELFINGELQDQYINIQHVYLVEFENDLSEKLIQSLKVDFGIDYKDMRTGGSSTLKEFFLTSKQVNDLKKQSWVKNVTANIAQKSDQKNQAWRVFPNCQGNDWTIDNFGPIYIPKKGDTIELTKDNYNLYRRAITAYEGNTLRREGATVYLNGEKVTSYTFNMDYYWMMGDNRHNSLDSRFWGFVPENHIVGKASFIWFSRDGELGMFKKGGIRWDRVFTKVK